MVVGNYGSGKTEVSVNLAIFLRKHGYQVEIADLDIVNPYFRCREARALMEEHSIRVVVPPGAQSSADLPIVLPELKGMLRPDESRFTLFDVGGDDVGARLLSTLAPHLDKVAREREGQPYELWQVINGRRPFTDSVEGCLRMRESIERASRLKVTGLIANTHLMEQTTPDVIVEGFELAAEVGEATDLPVVCVAAMEGLADASEVKGLGAPVFRMHRWMLPPWLSQTKQPRTSGDESVPAARSVPIGRPSGVE